MSTSDEVLLKHTSTPLRGRARSRPRGRAQARGGF